MPSLIQIHSIQHYIINMKRILFLLGFLIPIFLQAQKIDSAYIAGSTISNRMVNRNDLQINGATFLGIRDTTFIPNRNGAVVIRPQDQRAYQYTNGWFIIRTGADIFYIWLRSSGSPGDSLLRVSNDTFYTPKIRDSLSFHHHINTDGSWTMYSIGSGGGQNDTIINIDSIPNTDTIAGARQNTTYLKAQRHASADTIIVITDSSRQYANVWSYKFNTNALNNLGPIVRTGNYLRPKNNTDSFFIGGGSGGIFGVAGTSVFTANNQLAGQSNGLSGITLNMRQAAVANGVITNFFGYNMNMQASTGDSLLGQAIAYSVGTSNPSGYIGTGVGYLVDGGSLTNYGNFTEFEASDMTTGTGLVIGYYSNIAAGNEKYQIWMGGTGQSYFGGPVNLGSQSSLASAQLAMTSTTQGFLLPRMNTTQQNAISSPATGLQIFNTDSVAICVWNGSAWRKVGTGAGGISPWTQTGNYVSLVTPGDSVAIGTATPLAPLTVQGQALFTQTNTTAGFSGNLIGNQVNMTQAALANGATGTFTGYRAHVAANSGDTLTATYHFVASTLNPAGYIGTVNGFSDSAGFESNVGVHNSFVANVGSGAGHTYGFRSVIAPTATSYAFYNDGGAQMYTAGSFNLGSTTAYSSAALSITSTTQAFLPSRMNSSQMAAISTPVGGDLIYNTDSAALCYYNGTTSAWRVIGTGSSSGSTPIATVGLGISPIYRGSLPIDTFYHKAFRMFVTNADSSMEPDTNVLVNYRALDSAIATSSPTIYHFYSGSIFAGGYAQNITATLPADELVQVNFYLNITSGFTSGIIMNMDIYYTDETGTVVSIPLTPIGTSTTSITAAGKYLFPATIVRAKSGTIVELQFNQIGGPGGLNYTFNIAGASQLMGN